MGLRINQNVAALNSYRNLSVTDNQMGKSMEKLSSGFRINRAADDAAGLSISEGLRSQIGGLKVAVRNTQDAISVVQTAEGALTEVHSMLQRMRDLAVQSSNGSNDDKSREAINSEFTELATEIGRIASQTTFNNIKLLDGNFNKDFQVGYAAGDTMAVSISGVSSASSLTLNTTSKATIKTSIEAIDSAIEDVSSTRANLGAVQNRFEHTINNLNVSVENLSASESRIRDTDMALEMVEFTRAQILSQAGTSMLAQANQIPQGVLSLLR
jgi:flagellin